MSMNNFQCTLIEHSPLVCYYYTPAEEQAVLLAIEAKKRAWLAELKTHMEQDLEVHKSMQFT